MLVINLYGGPGSGKSTTAAGLFHTMKKKNMKVELVTEVAKEFVYDNCLEMLRDQMLVLALQNHRLERLRDTEVEYVISDSPLLLSAFYGEKYGLHPNITVPAVKALHATYNNMEVFIERTKPYSTLGRLGTEEGNIKKDAEIQKLLEEQGLYYTFKDDGALIENIMFYMDINKEEAL